MSKRTNNQLTQNILWAFISILVYSLLFHRADPIISTIVRSAGVAIIVGIILHLLRRK